MSARPTPVLPAVASKMVAPGTQLARALRFGDHAQRGAVFDAAARVQVLQLGVNVGGAGGNQLSKMKDRGFADQFGDLFGDAEGGHFSSLHRQIVRNSQDYVKGNATVNCRNSRFANAAEAGRSKVAGRTNAIEAPAVRLECRDQGFFNTV